MGGGGFGALQAILCSIFFFFKYGNEGLIFSPVPRAEPCQGEGVEGFFFHCWGDGRAAGWRRTVVPFLFIYLKKKIVCMLQVSWLQGYGWFTGGGRVEGGGSARVGGKKASHLYPEKNISRDHPTNHPGFFFLSFFILYILDGENRRNDPTVQYGFDLRPCRSRPLWLPRRRRFILAH